MYRNSLLLRFPMRKMSSSSQSGCFRWCSKENSSYMEFRRQLLAFCLLHTSISMWHKVF